MGMLKILLVSFAVVYQRIASESNVIDVLKTVEKINSHNRNYGYSWEASTYDLDHLDLDHFVQHRLGTKLLPQNSKRAFILDTRVQPASKYSADEKLPSYFNWANTTKTTCPVKNIRDQANCGSCWAVSTAAAFSDRLCIKSNGTFQTALSGNFIMACDKSNFGCDGGEMNTVNEFVVKTGVITGGEYESDIGCQTYSVRPCGFPNLPCGPGATITPKCRGMKCTNQWYARKFEKPNKVFKAKKWYYVKEEAEIMKEIYNNGPVTAAFLAYSDFIFYKQGIYRQSPNAKPLGGHAVRVVGWGEENNMTYWIVANSWTEKWGEMGFFRIQRGVNMCEFESEMTALVPDI